MEDEAKANPIPVAPSCLCFRKEEFMMDHFSIDDFISNHKKQVQLECLRDDLNVYLNVLKSAMIELINKDYADFVNLSSNLVGLDKAINHLSVPLGQLREEVLGVKSSVDEVIAAAQKKLFRKQALREKKVKVQKILNLYQRLAQVENLLNIDIIDDVSNMEIELTEEQTERLVIEAHQLKFDLDKSIGCPLSDNLEPRMKRVTRLLQDNLERLFLKSMASEEQSSLCRCLRIYSTIDKTPELETLVRKKIVEPQLSPLITENNLKKLGLSNILDDVITKVCAVCDRLIAFTSSNRNDEYVPGYDFLTHSIWPEIVASLERNIPSIFAPGNPKMFHQKYSASLKFLDKFEQQYSSIAQVNNFRQSDVYLSYAAKWNMPVYFQIRYQEIASALESSMSGETLAHSEKREFKLKVSQTLWQCLDSCWSDEMFLSSLTNRFWKLTMELISRFNVWSKKVVSKHEKALLTQNKETESDFHSISQSNISSNSKVEKPAENFNIQEIVLLISDIDKLIDMVPKFYNEVITKKLLLLNVKNMSVFEESIIELINQISKHPQSFENLLMSRVVIDCQVHLKMVNDIPRLYRRTNKDVPNKPSGYVTNILKPLQSFMNNHKDTLLSSESAVDRISTWKINVLEKVTEQYLSITSDVLTSVKKTEDSLKRLKKARENSNVSSVSGNNGVISDEDKIRHQLYLDVENYGHQITLFEVETTCVKSYLRILELVESVRSRPEKC